MDTYYLVRSPEALELRLLVSGAGRGLGRGSGGLDLTPTVQAAGDLNKAALDIAVGHSVTSTIKISSHISC